MSDVNGKTKEDSEKKDHEHHEEHEGDKEKGIVNTVVKELKDAGKAVDDAIHSETGQAIIHKTEEAAHQAYAAATSKEAISFYKATGDFFVNAWNTITPPIEKGWRQSTEFVWRITDDAFAKNAKRGEPDFGLVEWRRCKRCQAQFNPDDRSDKAPKCVFHVAKFECLASKEPLQIKHRNTADCDTACEGRFPCCGRFFKLSLVESNGCKTADRHTL